jgi:hypothetical protein
MKLIWRLVSIFVGLSVLTPVAAIGAPSVCGPNPSDCLVVFDPVGAVVSFAAVSEPEDRTILHVVPGVEPDRTAPATTLIEPGGTQANGPYSDTFGVGGVGNVLGLAFFSDDEVNSAPMAGGSQIFLFETSAGPYDATMLLSPALRAEGFTAQFFSDLDVVPEPTSAILLGSGLLGFVVICRRKVL